MRTVGRPVIGAGLVAAAALGFAAWRAVTPGGRDRLPPEVAARGAGATEAEVAAFCSGCHRMPDPACFPRDRWHAEVERGFHFHDLSSRPSVTVPAMATVTTYFRDRAPEELAIPEAPGTPDASGYRTIPVAPQPDGPVNPAISALRGLSPDGGGPALLLACDMGSGDLLAIDPSADRPRARTLAKVGHPAHVEPCDLDGDGAPELVVADLGSFLPEDHDRGRVVWLRPSGQGTYKPTVLLGGLGRVADVRPGDFDGDGDQDLVVAEFGWQRTGSIRVLINEGSDRGGPRFTPRGLDPRHGTIQVPTADWDGDGKSDFVALVSQEHETIELFLSGGDRVARIETVSPAQDPAFGSSGIEPADLDGDGDTDVLYTNGDTFDSYELKPYHGIRWVENRGPAGWVTHRLAALPGVHRALPGDLDGDGDADVAAVALLPDRLFDRRHAESAFDSVIWLEQVRPGEFVRHSLERGSCRHAALELGDYDGDGRLDLAVGNFQKPGDDSPATLWLRAGTAAGGRGGKGGAGP
jgi:hypothetical protein